MVYMSIYLKYDYVLLVLLVNTNNHSRGGQLPRWSPTIISSQDSYPCVVSSYIESVTNRIF